MPRPQKRIKLSSCQVSLIEKHYEEVKKHLKHKLIKCYGIRRVTQEELLDRAISYLVEVTPQFDPQGGCGYVRYCVERCAYKLIDEYRKRRLSKSKEKKRLDTKEALIKAKGYACDQDVVQELEGQGLSGKEVKDVMNMHVAATIPMTTFISEDRHNGREENSNSFADFFDPSGSEGVEKVEWHETKRKIIRKAKQQLSVPYYVVIKDYLLPKAENTGHKTLRELADTVGLSASRLSQMMIDDTMKMFFRDILLPESDRQAVAA